MTDRRFDVGDRVAYGTNGICAIDSIEMMSIVTGMPEMPYYVLKPENNENSTVYVPLKNEKLVSKMRSLLTPDEVREMLIYDEADRMKWSNDRRSRTEMFHGILSGGVHRDLIRMIDCIHTRKRKLISDGKKLPATDSNILKQAERLVVEEFSSVLEIPPREVGRYIKDLRDDQSCEAGGGGVEFGDRDGEA